MVNEIKGLLADGSLPSRARQDVATMIQEEAPQPDLTPYATHEQVSAAIADSVSGGYYISEDGNQTLYVMVASVDEPPTSMVIDGKTYEVWWVQTSPPDPNAWAPRAVVANLSARTYVVPSDAGATYTVDGSLKAAGSYPVGTAAATTLSWSAAPRPGYTFAAGTVTSGTMSWPVKTYPSGTVIFSDDFNDRSGNIGGSKTNSFDGGEAMTWVETGLSSGTIVNGVLTAPAADYSWPRITLPSPAHVVAEFVARPIAGLDDAASIKLYLEDGGRVEAGGRAAQFPSGGSGQTYGAPTYSVGDVVRATYRVNSLTIENVTTGDSRTHTSDSTPAFTMTSPVESIRFDLRPGAASGYTQGVDDVKVTVA